ncbi:formyltransferase family protein [Curvivirga sp.]|uniref:formyltransferase family protein n=1 Tax=Curvivirga sp. TaxID=2856848 RepID=UPI003B5BA178
MKISIIVDNPSWIIPHAELIVDELVVRGYEARFYSNYNDVEKGDIAFYLGCLNITPKEVLSLNTHNLVVHASDLPKGRGFSPWAYDVLAGKDELTVCLIAMDHPVDSGAIYIKEKISLTGTELVDKLRQLLGEKTVQLCLHFVENHQNMEPMPQKGEASFLVRRGPEDSELDVKKSIQEQFNLLRIVDNEKYPAFFVYNGMKYKISITEVED